MMIEEQLRERLRKIEALYFRATSTGEREAAGAAAERLKAKLDEAARHVECCAPQQAAGAAVASATVICPNLA